MALRDINIFEKHVEKIVLGAAGAGAIFMLYLASQKVTVEVQNVPEPVAANDVEHVIHEALGDPLPPLSPDQLKVLEGKHDLTVAESMAMIEAYGNPNVQVPDLVGIYRRLSHENPLDTSLVQVAVPTFGGANLSPQRIIGPAVIGDETVLKTPDAPAPVREFLQAVPMEFQVTTVDPAGIVLPLPPGTVLATAEKKVVVIDGWIPTGQMLKQMLSERERKARIPTDRLRAVIQDIKVTRQEVLPTGGMTDPIVVKPPKSATPVEPVAWGALTSDDVPTAMEGLDAQFKPIVLPDFDRDAQGVPIPPPILTRPVPEKIDQENKDLQAAVDAAKSGGALTVAGRTPVTPGVPVTTAPAVMLPTEISQIKTMAVVPFTFWDDTVKAGHTYVYKVAVEFVNPVFGWKQGLANPNDATKQFLAAEPITTDKVHVNADVEFFVGGDSISKPGDVQVRLFKHANGRWYTREIDVPVGAHIAGTIATPDEGANHTMDVDTDFTVVDMRSTRSGPSIGGAGVHVILRDPLGNLVTRDSATDSTNPELNTLLDDVRKSTTTAPATEPGGTVQPPNRGVTPPTRSGTTMPPTTRRSTPIPVAPARGR